MRRRRGLIIIAGVAALVFAVVGGRLALRVAAAGTPNGLGLAALTADEHRVAIIFGAGLSPDGTPSPLLDDRLKAGEELYRRGVVDRLLMTGDNSVVEHNEPSAMRRASLTRGIPSDVIAVDYGGRRTWDSCNRARQVFGVRDAVVVSSDFHAARTVVTCRAAGVTVDGVVGVSTGRFGIGDRTSWRVRELGASWRGLYDAWISHPDTPVKGDPIDIYDPDDVRESLSPSDRETTTRTTTSTP